ncbi:hypothetical protein L6164_019601 [Bauhinia variegata]|uniref:Uncharacterized protein n=1 Tax=Bauhinia variegata TaxID=167791 RepID=A0ACB9MTQ6_BAUVA|nr:hypothetical protein L6164_019601 [Bauhinia variegata]
MSWSWLFGHGRFLLHSLGLFSAGILFLMFSLELFCGVFEALFTFHFLKFQFISSSSRNWGSTLAFVKVANSISYVNGIAFSGFL